jgi:uncharacterized protein
MSDIKIGVISDTHGMLRPQILEIFKGCKYIIHAGDICSSNIPFELGAISELIAVQGNMDRSDFPALADKLDYTKILELDDIRIFIGHEPERVTDLYESNSTNEKFSILINGHTHIPSLEWRKKILKLNPGAAGKSNLRALPTVAVIDIINGYPIICFKSLE